jgi:hybrid cluster-associated redox disulfide protein
MTQGGIVLKITKDMTIQEVVEKFPQTIQVFMMHGLGCMGCAIANFENIEQGAMAHGIDVDKLVEDLNKSVEDLEK